MAKILIGNVKGPQGDTGAQGAAGTIANVTASVNNTVGTPSVDVTLGGTPQNRTFNLAFKNLKGDTGAQGTMDHRALGHRNDANQHTIAAITGLQNALETSGAHIGPTAPTDATKIWVDTDENSEALPLATTTEPGLMSAEDKTKLDNILDLVYPIGSIYMSVNNVDPQVIFEGTWEKIEGKFLLGASSAYPVGSTGGEATHKLTVDEMPKHAHGFITHAGGIGSSGSNAQIGFVGQTPPREIYTNNVGGNQAHNNMPPYLAVYMWQRTA